MVEAITLRVRDWEHTGALRVAAGCFIASGCVILDGPMDHMVRLQKLAAYMTAWLNVYDAGFKQPEVWRAFTVAASGLMQVTMASATAAMSEALLTRVACLGNTEAALRGHRPPREEQHPRTGQGAGRGRGSGALGRVKRGRESSSSSAGSSSADERPKGASGAKPRRK